MKRSLVFSCFMSSCFIFSPVECSDFHVNQLVKYYTRWQGFKGKASQLPSWARFVLLIAAIPGIVLIALSILAFLVSLLALLLLTVPLYRMLCGLCGVRTDFAAPPGQSGFG